MDVEQVVPRDAIPSIDDPTFGTTFDGDDDDRVIVIEGDPARAYPLRILHFHEVVNDTVDGLPVVVTWCPLCGSAVAYERFVDGQTLTFGVSGKLADDDLVMYDHETGSEWKQSTGVCLSGDLEGITLTARPAPMFSYAGFRDRYPSGRVLQPPGRASGAAGPGDEPQQIDYDVDPYAEYWAGDGFGLSVHRGEGSRVWERTDIGPKEPVLGLRIGDDALGFPESRVADVCTTTVGGVDVVVFGTPGGLHAFEQPGHEFHPAGSPGTFRADGTRWDGATGVAADGRQLLRLPARRLFAFAWTDDHGDDAFYQDG